MTDPTPRALDADNDGKPDYSGGPRFAIEYYAKAVAAFIAPAVALAVGFTLAASDGGTTITGSEWISMLSASLAASGFVYAVPNAVR